MSAEVFTVNIPPTGDSTIDYYLAEFAATCRGLYKMHPGAAFDALALLLLELGRSAPSGGPDQFTKLMKALEEFKAKGLISRDTAGVAR